MTSTQNAQLIAGAFFLWGVVSLVLITVWPQFALVPLWIAQLSSVLFMIVSGAILATLYKWRYLQRVLLIALPATFSVMLVGLALAPDPLTCTYSDGSTIQPLNPLQCRVEVGAVALSMALATVWIAIKNPSLSDPDSPEP